MSRLFLPRVRGFTLIELIMVMVLTGILGAVGASRFFSRSSFDGPLFADQARAMVRHAQKLAIGQHRSVYVRLDGRSVALCYSKDCAVVPAVPGPAVPFPQVRAPAGKNGGSKATLSACVSDTWFCEGLPPGMTMTYLPAPTVPASTPFFFDPAGKPYNSNDDDSKATSTFVVPLIVTINGGDGSASNVAIENETGYVH